MEIETLKELAEKVKNQTASQEEINTYLEIVNGLLSEVTDGVEIPSENK